MPGLSLAAWREELYNDPDKNFILAGVEHGFDIVDSDREITPVSCDNHPSAKPGSPLYEAAAKQIVKEIECGNYIVCEEVPEIVSTNGCHPQTRWGVRLIHDCSRPVGTAVNDYCSTDWKQKLSRVDDAANLMPLGCFFAKVDLRSA